MRRSAQRAPSVFLLPIAARQASTAFRRSRAWTAIWGTIMGEFGVACGPSPSLPMTGGSERILKETTESAFFVVAIAAVTVRRSIAPGSM